MSVTNCVRASILSFLFACITLMFSCDVSALEREKALLFVLVDDAGNPIFHAVSEEEQRNQALSVVLYKNDSELLRVDARENGTAVFWETDISGRVQPGDSVTVTAFSKDGLLRSDLHTVTIPENRVTSNIIFMRKAGRIQGKFKDSKGMPLAHRRVRTNEINYHIAEVYTDKYGNFDLDGVPRGKVVLTAYSGSSGNAEDGLESEPFNVGWGKTVDAVEMVYPEALYPISGTIVLPEAVTIEDNNQPRSFSIQGAYKHKDSIDNAWTNITYAPGNRFYLYANQPGEMAITIRNPQEHYLEQELKAQTGDMDVVAIMKAASFIHGKVLDEASGEPVIGAQVHLQKLGAKGGGVSIARTNVMNEEGVFKFPFTKSQEYQLEVSRKGYASRYFPLGRCEVGQDPNFYTVTLQRSHKLQGTVVDEAGNGIEGVKIKKYTEEHLVLPANDFNVIAESNALGVYIIDTEEIEEKYLYFLHPDYEPVLADVSGEAQRPIPSKVVLKKGAIISGTVMLGEQAQKNVSLNLNMNTKIGPFPEMLIIGKAQTDEQGEYVYKGLPNEAEASFSVSLKQSSGATLSMSKTIPQLASINKVDFKFKKGTGTISGHYILPENTQNFRISVSPVDAPDKENQYHSQIGRGGNGDFYFENILPGQHKLQATSNNT